MVVHYEYECVALTVTNMVAIVESVPNTYLVIINSRATPQIQEFLTTISSDRVDIVNLPINFGFNNCINYYIRDFISDENLPSTIIQMGSDILFNQKDFETLVDAITHLPGHGTIGLSYENNACNPERNVLNAKNVRGSNGKCYPIRHTFLCPVAGGIMGIRGSILRDHLNYKLFHPNQLPRHYLDILGVGGADAALYNALKWRFKSGYVANTRALHMKSRDGSIVDIPSHWRSYIQDVNVQGIHVKNE